MILRRTKTGVDGGIKVLIVLCHVPVRPIVVVCRGCESCPRRPTSSLSNMNENQWSFHAMTTPLAYFQIDPFRFLIRRCVGAWCGGVVNVGSHDAAVTLGTSHFCPYFNRRFEDTNVPTISGYRNSAPFFSVGGFIDAWNSWDDVVGCPWYM